LGAVEKHGRLDMFGVERRRAGLALLKRIAASEDRIREEVRAWIAPGSQAGESWERGVEEETAVGFLKKMEENWRLGSLAEVEVVLRPENRAVVEEGVLR